MSILCAQKTTKITRGSLSMAIEIALNTRKFQMHVEIAIWKKPGFSSIG